MHYNPNWGKRPAVNPVALDTLIAWLETKLADEKYRYDRGFCMMAKYLRSMFASVESTFAERNLYKYVVDGQTIDMSAFEDIAVPKPHTYDAALSRAQHCKFIPRQRTLKSLLPYKRRKVTSSLVAIGAALVLSCSVRYSAAQNFGDAQRGSALVRDLCSECHAVAPGQRSKNEAAPTFEVIAKTGGMVGTRAGGGLEYDPPPDAKCYAVVAGPSGHHRVH